MNILFACSEAFPFIKTGGLGDVAHALPVALRKLGDDVRLVLPAYRDALEACDDIIELGGFTVKGFTSNYPLRLLQASKNGFDTVVYLIDIPELYGRPGNPYCDEKGQPWADNTERFAVFSQAISLLSQYLAELETKYSWSVDVVHCNDWQTGMVPAFLKASNHQLKSVFTIHNLAYDGQLSHEEFIQLGFPEEWWSIDFVEFHGHASMLKSAMIFANAVTTVSPNYAREICTEELGFGFDGVLRSLGDKFSGILNGIDLNEWNPETDVYIQQNYSSGKQLASGKRANKLALLKDTQLPQNNMPLLGFIGRLVEQKGIALICEILPKLFKTTNVCMIILGSGQSHYETELRNLAKAWPKRLSLHIGYSESLAHRVEAGCDLFLMPSIFEPCGLNQMYSLRYGTLPIVNNTGGLADTVVDTILPTVKNQSANGFVMKNADVDSLFACINNALQLYANKALWEQLQNTAMKQDLGWISSAKAYRKLYAAQHSKPGKNKLDNNKSSKNEPRISA
jgi:starch synthase